MKNEELEAMIKEASGPINFTVFLTMFGEKLKGGHLILTNCHFTDVVFDITCITLRVTYVYSVIGTSS